ncbi:MULTISPECIES: hypothetical protein [unclassified Streptomyces]|nr:MULTISPECIES: hypothetical protein [unclassified Streptomyces]MCX5328649.1 hypothetical protein [Streptomyces sp. NBC_00140]MCX5358062.1 hypothetical protein [Streptomyces sp. NBC_00124]
MDLRGQVGGGAQGPRAAANVPELEAVLAEDTTWTSRASGVARGSGR